MSKLIEAGALRQYLSNTGEGPYIAAYDLEITNRLLAHLEIEKVAQGERIEQDARIIEILRAQVKRMEEQQNTHRPDFLLNGTRFKLNFSTRGNVDVFHNYARELQGRWVALVPAEDDCHLTDSASGRAQRTTIDNAPATGIPAGEAAILYTSSRELVEVLRKGGGILTIDTKAGKYFDTMMAAPAHPGEQNAKVCCTQDCNQGRDCPNRNK